VSGVTIGLSISARRWSEPGAFRFGSCRMAASMSSVSKGVSSSVGCGGGGRGGGVGRLGGSRRPSHTEDRCWLITVAAALGPSGWTKECCCWRRRRMTLILEVALTKSRSKASQNALYARRRAALMSRRKARWASRCRIHQAAFSSPTARRHLR
jgi:hypothetical protein